MLAGRAHSLLDHNCDGKLDKEDIYNSALSAYEFVTSISLSDINEMKLELYRKAIVYMKAELKHDKKIARDLKESQIKQEWLTFNHSNCIFAYIRELINNLKILL